MICERCSAQVHYLEKCQSCGKNMCNMCVKSAKRHNKTTRVAICKDCWGKMSARKKFKAVK